MKNKSKIALTLSCTVLAGASFLTPMILKQNNIYSIKKYNRIINDNQRCFVDWDDSIGNLYNSNNATLSEYLNYSSLINKIKNKYTFELSDYEKYFSKSTNDVKTFFNNNLWFGKNKFSFLDTKTFNNLMKQENIKLSTKNKIQKFKKLSDSHQQNRKKYYQSEYYWNTIKQLDNLQEVYLSVTSVMDLYEIANSKNIIDLINAFKNDDIIQLKTTSNQFDYVIKVKSNRKKLDIKNISNYLVNKKLDSNLPNEMINIQNNQNEYDQIVEKVNEYINDLTIKITNNLKEYFNILNKNIELIINSSNVCFLNDNEHKKLEDILNKIQTSQDIKNEENNIKLTLLKIKNSIKNNWKNEWNTNQNIKQNNIKLYELNNQINLDIDLFKKLMLYLDNKIQEVIIKPDDYKKLELLEGTQTLKIEFDLNKMKQDSNVDWDNFANQMNNNNGILSKKNLTTKMMIENNKFFESLFNCSEEDGVALLNSKLNLNVGYLGELNSQTWTNKYDESNTLEEYNYFTIGNVKNKELNFNNPVLFAKAKINSKKLIDRYYGLSTKFMYSKIEAKKQERSNIEKLNDLDKINKSLQIQDINYLKLPSTDENGNIITDDNNDIVYTYSNYTNWVNNWKKQLQDKYSDIIRNESNSKLSVGAYIGIGIGSFIVLATIISLILAFRKKRK